jgi:lambda family phage portal protein
MTKKRSYTAAQKIARYGDLKSSSGSADYELMHSLTDLRQKARFLARNSGTMRRFIQLMKDNVIGESGFSFQAGNPRVEAAWAKWCQSPTVDGQMSIVEFAKQMVASWCRDGEFFFEFVLNNRFPDMISLNPLESDMIDESINTIHPATKNQIKMGVEIDDFGAPVAYHVLTTHPGDTNWVQNYNKPRHRRVPAENIVHVFERLRPGQTRGEPPASACINTMKMLDGYREAETMNRRIAAATMGFFSREMPKAETIQALADKKEEGEDGEEMFIMNIEPGTLKQMPDGMRFDKFDPGGSVTDYAQFEAQLKKELAMALGISVFSLGMETNAISYSTSRSVLMEDRAFYKGMQSFFIHLGMRVIFNRWAQMHTISPGSSIPPTRLQSMVAEAKFRGRGWPWIDPASEVKANAEALRTLQTSYTQIAADRGMDVADLFAEIQADQALMKRFGLTVTETEGKEEASKDETDDTKDN